MEKVKPKLFHQWSLDGGGLLRGNVALDSPGATLYIIHSMLLHFILKLTFESKIHDNPLHEKAVKTTI